MKFIFLITALSISGPLFPSQEITGEFTTVTESGCSSEIHFLENGKGVFIDSCRYEDGSYVGDIYKDEISWKINNKKLIVNINGINENFTYHRKLSCGYFGEKGDSEGLIGLDLYFLRKPVKCK